MSILIVTDPADDGHVLPVVRELGRRGHDLRVFDPGALPLSATATIDWSPTGSRALITWGGQEIDAASIGSAWYRRPGRFSIPEELTPKESEWLRGEWTAAVNSIYALTDALWVSIPHNIRRAELKLLQLQIAQRVGLRVPPYTVTNDPVRARSFLDEHPAGVVVKALSMPALQLEGRRGMIFTHVVTQEDAEQIESVRYGPTLLQELVPKARDIRVTVIGERVFAAGIESMTMAGSRIDFRAAEIMDLPHVPMTLPPAVASACTALMNELGLQFGAIDLLETPDGDYVFLEINPNGQWYWVEMMTGQPMAKAMADLLERGESERGRGPDENRAFTPVPRPPQLLPVGDHSIPLAPSIGNHLKTENLGADVDLVGTRVWLDSKGGRVSIHVGDTELDDR